jgi:integrase
MAKKTPRKPKKPSKTFPLFAHNNGSWAKKIRGKLHYFGGWGDPEAALKRYRAVAADLEAGRRVSISRGRLTIRDLCNRFLTNRQRSLAAGDIVERTFLDYRGTCDRIIQFFGKPREVEALRPSDFGQFRVELTKTWGPYRVRSEIQRIRTVFKFAADNDLIDRPVRFGSEFRSPSRRALEQAKIDRGPKMFEAHEIRQIIAAAAEPMKTMILLGINAAFGPADIGRLPVSALDLDGGWVDFPRPKTCVARRCPLWPETVDALRGGIEVWPDGLVFHTSRGNPWDGRGTSHPISVMFGRLLRQLDLHKPGRGFYALRHSHATVSGDAKDQIATNAIMGHVDGSMAGVYRERIEDDRLVAVVNHVRQWLLGLDDQAGSEPEQQETGATKPGLKLYREA